MKLQVLDLPCYLYYRRNPHTLTPLAHQNHQLAAALIHQMRPTRPDYRRYLGYQ